MTESELIILDPVAGPKAASSGLAIRPTKLKGLKVGYLDNGWWSFGLLIGRVQQHLEQRFGAEMTVRLMKAKSSPATKQIDELAEKCQVVINGLGN